MLFMKEDDMGRLLKTTIVFLAACMLTAAALAAPVISDVRVEKVYGNTAVVTWTTDTESTSRVTYDKTTPPSTYTSNSTMLTAHSMVITGLDTCSTYYFSVMSTDGAGSTTDNNGGSYYQLKTGLNTQSTYNATGLPLTIPAATALPTPGVRTSTLSVSDTRTVDDIEVTIGSMTFNGVFYLSVFLVAPDSTKIPLTLRNGTYDTANYTNTLFDDDATTYVSQEGAPFTGRFKPNGQLSHLYGKSANGTWTLRIENYSDTITGTLDSWSISISYPYQYCENHLKNTGYTVIDNCTGMGNGDGNGIVDPGEDITLQVAIKNDGNANQTGISGTLTTSTSGITITDGSASFPDLATNATGTSVSPHFAFSVAVASNCATEISFNLHLVSAQKPAGWDIPVTVPIGDVTPTSGTPLSEDFTLGIPATWTIVDGGSGGGVAATWTTANPIQRAGLPPLNDPWAMVDSDYAGESSTSDEELITPVLDLSTASAVTLEYDGEFIYAGAEIGDVDVRSSLTSGSWVNVRRNQGVDTVGHRTIDISSQAAGASDVQIRFHYYDAAWAYWWIVDNVKVTYTASQTCSMDVCCPLMNAPYNVNITDDHACAQDGITITFTAGTPATRHDLYVDNVETRTNVTSPLTYNPGDSASHSYYIKAINGLPACYIDSSSQSFTDENKTPATPAAPSVSDVDACATTGVTITWGTVSQATSYDLYVDGATTVTGVTSPYTYLPGNTNSHNYQVRGKNTYCTGAWSSATSGTDANSMPGTPAAPSVADVSVCALSGVTITWGTVSQATSYDLYVDGTTTVSGITSPYTYSPGNTNSHNYQVRGRNGTCTGAWSTATAGTDQNLMPGTPSAPTVADISACATNGVTITWGTVSQATAYDLYVDGTTTVSGVTSPYTYSPGNTASHSYQVRGRNTSCTGAWSTATAGSDANLTPGTPTVSAVTDVNACSTSGVTITWGTVSQATSYDLYVDSTTTVTGVTSPYTYSPGNTSSHTYQIRGKNATCTGAWSTGVAGSDANLTPDTPTISAVTDISSCATSGVTITWGTVSQATSYDLYVDSTTTVSGVTSPYTYSPGNTVSHSYQVRGRNATCTGAWSPGVSGSDTNLTPGTPTISSVTDISACAVSGVTVTWGTVSQATSYDLYVDSTTTVTGVTSPYTYYPGDTASHTYQVRGVNATCTGTWSTGVARSDADNSVISPAAPVVTDDNACAQSGVTVTWGTVSGATGYDLMIDTTTFTSVTSPYPFNPGNTGTHSYKIRAKNASCTSDWSSSTSQADANNSVAVPTISGVTDVSACASSGVAVAWGTVSGATGYDLYVDSSTLVTGVSSPYTYTPGDSVSHSYQVRSKNASCQSAWSTSSSGSDINDTPGTPAITSIADDNPCSQNGIRVYYTAGAGATSHNLLRNGSVVVVGYSSGDLYAPGNSNLYTYVVRAIKSTCSSDSPGQDGTDISDAVGEPTITGITDDSACTAGIRISYTAGSGANQHDLFKDSVLAVNNYTSGALYSPGDTSSHSYVIRAVKGVCYTNSLPQSFTDANSAVGTPSAPSVADISVCALSGVTVTWGTVSGATAYDLYIDSATLLTGVTSPYTYAPGNTSSHSYQVRGTNASCTGAWSTATAGTDSNSSVATPAAPVVSDVNACAQSGITVTWDTVTGATGYDLMVDTTTFTGVTSPYSFNPGNVGTHTYKVRGKNASCIGEWSSSTAAADGNATVGTPAAPTVTDLTACATTGVSVTWNTVANATGYDIYVDSTTVVSDVTSPYTYTPGDNISHNYQVRGKNATCGNGSWSAITAATDANGKPGTPAAPTVTDINPCALSGVTVTWSTVTGATGYDLFIDATTIVSSVTSPYTYTPGNTNSHSYQVRGKNAACGTGAWSAATAGTDADGTIGTPAAPGVADVSACAVSGVTITWTTVSGATAYDLYIDSTTLLTGVTSPYTYAPGNTVSHSYQVRGTNASCTGAWSSATAGSDLNNTPGTPAAPAVADISACALSGVTVTWGTVSGATAYDLYVDSTTLLTGVTSPYTYAPGNTVSHSYQVRAKNASCQGSWSSSSSGSDLNNSPSAVTLSASDPDGGTTCGITISWTGGVGAGSFDLYVDNVQTVTGVPSNPYTYNPGNTTSHNYMIRAINGGCTTDSNTAAASDPGCGCLAPTAEVTDDKTPAGDKTQFTWTAIAADRCKVVRGIQSNLAALVDGTSDFACYASNLTTSVNIAADDPSGVTGRCYYYLIAGYNCSDSSQYVGPYGLGKSGAQRVVNQSSACTP